MRYRIWVSIGVDATNDRQAYEHAKKLEELLKSPLVRMSVEGAGVRLTDESGPVVHQPQRETA